MIEYFLPAASTYASDIDWLFDLIFWFVGFWFVLCQGVFFWLIFRFRKKEGVPAQYISGELKTEKKWITWPHLAVLVCDVFIIYGAVKVWYDVKQNLPPAQFEIRAVAQQWAWTFQHPGPDGKLDTDDDISKINELHIAKDTLYHVHMESKDVLHNFSVPVFRLKQDVIPGRVITGWFKTNEITGEFSIQCAEICGIGHALMGARVHIETPEEHAAWIANNSSISLASAATPSVEE